MSLLVWFRNFSASPESPFQIHLKVLLAKRISIYLKSLTGSNLEIIPAKARVQTSRDWTMRVLIALAVVANVGSAVAQRPIGIDISDYQSASLNWTTLKSTYGVSFAWAKAMEGTCSTSCGGGNWPTYCANAKAAGVYIGPYHFARYDLDTGTNGAVTEANAFWSTVQSYVKADGLTLMPMLDVEETNTSGYTSTTMSQWVDTWCTTVSNKAYASGLKLKPCIYASSSYAGNWFNSSVTKWNTDVADWPYAHSTAASQAQSGSPLFSPWPTWQFWQYDDENVAQAYTTGDGDIFNGTLAQLQSTMLVVAAGPSITAQPTNLTIASGINASFSVTAIGGGTIQYQWKFNGTNISLATSSTYTITNVQITNAGNFAVSVKDNTGVTIQSTNVYLAVVGPLTNAPGSTVVVPAGMVDWWPADGNGNNIFGTVTAIPATNLTYSAGEIGLAFQFNGSSSFLKTGAADIPVPWTACMWVNRASGAGTSAGLLEDGTYALKLEQYSNTFDVGLSILGVGDYVFSPAYSAPIGTWVHLAFVGTSSNTSLYVNGAFQGSLTNSIPLPRAYIGAGYVTSSAKYIDFLAGSLDEIMLFNQALSATQINSIYGAGNSGLVRAAQLVGYSSPRAGLYTLNLQGETGKTISIYTSPDLTNWSSSAKVGNTTGVTAWTDTRATNFPAKYYRVSSP